MSEKERWGFRSHPLRSVAVLIAIVLVCTGLGLIAGGFMKADAAEVQATTCSDYGQVKCGQVKRIHRRAARRINNGKIKSTGDSFDLREAFKSPRAAKRWYVRRIQAGIAASQGTSGSMRGATSAHAKALYLQAVNTPECGAVAKANNFDNWLNERTMCQIKNWPDTEGGDPEWISKKEVQVYGSVLFCGSSIAIGVAASGATFGLTAAGAVAAAGSCGISVWSQLDPG